MHPPTRGAECIQNTSRISTEGIQTHSSTNRNNHSPAINGAQKDAPQPMPGSQLPNDQERLGRIQDPDAITSAEPLSSTSFQLNEIVSSCAWNADSSEDHGRPILPVSQGIPAELHSLLEEIVFVLTCTGGQLVAALLIGHVAVTQAAFGDALGILPSQLPWLLGSSSLAAGLSVIISGSLADLTPPKPLMVGGFLWSALWNLIAAVSISPRLKVLFFVARAMQGLAAGVLVSASMSILGRVYNPGIRKTRVFSLMAAGSPFGYWLGCLQAGALSSHLPWIFGSTAILIAGFALTAHLTIPSLRPSSDNNTSEILSWRQFDFTGAGLAATGCGLLVFGLTQGSSAQWNPYTYISIILGIVTLGGFYLFEKRAARPLVPNNLWKTPGFKGLLVSYFLGLGAYSELIDSFFIPKHC
jgi:MFS family permease